MIEVKFYEEVADELLKFAVIISRYKDKWVYCKHRDRDTLEVPGGHREEGEDIWDTAERELYEETGAYEFKLKDMGPYSVTDNGKETFGRLYFANIDEFTQLPPLEIEKIVLCEEMPKALTYPLILPKLVEYAKQKLKEEYLLLEEELPINKRVVIRGEETQLLSIVKEEGVRKLLMLFSAKDGEGAIHRGDYKSNRERMMEQLKDKSSYGSGRIDIKGIKVGEQAFNIRRSSSRRLMYYHERDYEIYTYFKEKGYIPKAWVEDSMEELILSEYKLESDKELSAGDMNKVTPIILKVDKAHYTISIQHPFSVNIGKAEPNTRVQYFDEVTGKKRVFYIEEVEKCYYYDESLKRLEEILQNIEPEERESFKETYIEDLQETCPPDKALILLHYETEEGEQLNFFTKEYLEEKPEDRMYSHITGFIRKGNGINGYPGRTELIKTVEKDFDEALEIELFSRYVTIPEEEILVD